MKIARIEHAIMEVRTVGGVPQAYVRTVLTYEDGRKTETSRSWMEVVPGQCIFVHFGKDLDELPDDRQMRVIHI